MENTREKCLRESVQVAPHLLIGGPKKTTEQMQGDEDCLDSRAGEACGTQLRARVPERLQIGDAGLLGDGWRYWMALLPTHLYSQGAPFPTPKKAGDVLSAEGGPEALWEDRRLLTEKVGSRRKSAHGVSSPQTPPWCTHSTCTTGRAWGHHQEGRPSTSPSPNTHLRSSVFTCVKV